MEEVALICGIQQLFKWREQGCFNAPTILCLIKTKIKKMNNRHLVKEVDSTKRNVETLIDALVDEIETLELDKDTMQDEIDKLKEIIDELEYEINQLKGSIS